MGYSSVCCGTRASNLALCLWVRVVYIRVGGHECHVSYMFYNFIPCSMLFIYTLFYLCHLELCELTVDWHTTRGHSMGVTDLHAAGGGQD